MLNLKTSPNACWCAAAPPSSSSSCSQSRVTRAMDNVLESDAWMGVGSIPTAVAVAMAAAALGSFMVKLKLMIVEVEKLSQSQSRLCFCGSDLKSCVDADDESMVPDMKNLARRYYFFCS